MNSQIPRGAVLFAAVSTLSIVALWLFAVPATVSYSTFAFLTVILLGGSGVALMSWRNAQATDNVAHILYTTEASASTGPPTRAR